MILMLFAVILIFAGIPVLNHLEKKELKEQPNNEFFLLELKEHTSPVKVALYVAIGVLLFLFATPAEITTTVAIIKIMLLLGIYLIDDFTKTRVYMTDENIYMIEHLKHAKLVYGKRLKKGEIYHAELINAKDRLYQLYYYSRGKYVTKINVKLAKKEDADILKKLLKRQMNIQVLEREQVEHDAVKDDSLEKDYQILDRMTKIFLLVVMIGMAYGLLNTISNNHQGVPLMEQVLSNVIALQLIPFALYLFSFFFLKASGYLKNIRQFKKIRVDEKILSIFYIVGASTLPFVPLVRNGVVEGDRFLKVHMVGFLLFGFIMLAGMLFGNFYKTYKKRKDKNVV